MGSGWAPSHTVYVDALLAGKAQPVPAGVPATVSPASLPMHNDPSGTVALIFWLAGLVLAQFRRQLDMGEVGPVRDLDRRGACLPRRAMGDERRPHAVAAQPAVRGRGSRIGFSQMTADSPSQRGGDPGLWKPPRVGRGLGRSNRALTRQWRTGRWPDARSGDSDKSQVRRVGVASMLTSVSDNAGRVDGHVTGHACPVRPSSDPSKGRLKLAGRRLNPQATARRRRRSTKSAAKPARTRAAIVAPAITPAGEEPPPLLDVRPTRGLRGALSPPQWSSWSS